MSKSITVPRKILKINSEDIRHYTEMFLFKNRNNPEHMNKNLKNSMWHYELDWRNNLNSEAVISLGESNTIRMLDKIVGIQDNMRELYQDKKEAIKLKRLGTEDVESDYYGKSIKQIYDEIDDLQFQENYISIIFNTKSDFKLINKNGVKINGKTFKRLYGTSSGVKCNTVVYVCNDKVRKSEKTIHDILIAKLENEYDKNVSLVPSKYEAYLSLNSSASTVVFSDFEPHEILIVPDQENEINTVATLIGECANGEPSILENEPYSFMLEQSDGGGIVDKEIAEQWAEDLELNYTPSVFITRNSFWKGTLGTMEISELLERYKGEFGEVYDVWNLNKPKEDRIPHDVSKIKIIAPVSMLKLWKCYSGIEDYLLKCKNNGHSFAVTKATPKKLENERRLNYQFVQSLYLDDDDINGLTKNTIDAFHDILKNDITKTILYSKGTSMNKVSVEKSDNDCFKAMMIDDRMLNDMHIKRTIYKMIRNSIDKAKISKLKTRGNFQMIIPDLVSFFKHSVGMEDTSGVLKEGEFYSEYWNNLGVGEVVAMRAPACTHANFRKLNFVKEVKDLDLLKHIKTAIVFNGYDSTAESISGADK